MDVCMNSEFLERNWAQEVPNETDQNSAGDKNLLTPEELRIALSKLQVKEFQFDCSGYLDDALQLGITLDNKFIKFETNQNNQSCPSELEGSSSSPAPLRLISAMKGGREREWGLPREKMRVKWAEDVYDPPTTSMSHTVKNGYSYLKQRTKPKKDSQKQKHKRKKKKKPALERQLLPDRVLAPESGCDAAISWQEAKCGSSVMLGELETLRYAVAEAT